jgi:hypothetical protein
VVHASRWASAAGRRARRGVASSTRGGHRRRGASSRVGPTPRCACRRRRASSSAAAAVRPPDPWRSRSRCRGRGVKAAPITAPSGPGRVVIHASGHDLEPRVGPYRSLQLPRALGQTADRRGDYGLAANATRRPHAIGTRRTSAPPQRSTTTWPGTLLRLGTPDRRRRCSKTSCKSACGSTTASTSRGAIRTRAIRSYP